MSRTVSLATYIFRRLGQLGVSSVHGVPGDYTLRALDALKPAGLRWIGNCNELNAGYAADGYAKIKGISALFTTYGVGELSAINAVAGSYAEYAPVVHIVGTAARKAYRSKAMVHHSLGDGNLRVFADIYKHFTVAQASLFDVETAPSLVDRALEQCVKESRPVYLELPSDMVGVQVPERTLEIPLDTTPLPNATNKEDAVVATILERIYSAKQPYILVDGLAAPNNITEEVNEFARTTGFPTFSLTFGGGIVDGTLPNYHGVHAGKFGSLDFTSYTDTADLALLFGPLLSDTNTQGWSVVPSKDVTVAFHRNRIDIGNSQPHVMHAKSVMRNLLNKLDKSRLPECAAKTATLGSVRKLAKQVPAAIADAPIDQDSFYLRISSFFKPKDIIVCANGTPLVGGRDFVLPPDTTLINSAIWVSVGHMLPATQGIALAQQELGTGGRTIFFEGDGGFQATAQELGTIIKHKLNAYIFLINNDGYTFERLIHGMDAEYNDVAKWQYLEVPRAFGSIKDPNYPIEVNKITTWGQLEKLLNTKSFQNGRGLKLVDVSMARGDVTKNFKAALKLAGEQLMATSE